MGKNVENSSIISNTATSNEVADSLGENQDSPSLEQLNYKAKELQKQTKSHDIIEDKEQKKADFDLESELLTLGVSITDKKIKEAIKNENNIDNELSNSEKIKNFTESIRQGKSQTEILKLLIAKFENEEAVSTWVDNWKNFLKLYQFAENKSPVERNAIQKIIAKADFSSENAFSSSLAEISNSAEISMETKLEILREFNGENVVSVDEMDAGLKQMKNRKQQFDAVISTKKTEVNLLNSEIDDLEEEIKSLPLESTKRKDLETELEEKKVVLEQKNVEVEHLEKTKPKDVSFKLREGFSAKLNADGSRSIQILNKDFSIKLPSNFLPLTTTRNLRSINLAFPYLALKELNIANEIFSPNIENNKIPTKSQRDMGHLIFEALGIDDSKILPKEKINQLNKDLEKLVSIPGKTGKECLIEKGVFDVDSQSIIKSNFLEALHHIKLTSNSNL